MRPSTRSRGVASAGTATARAEQTRAAHRRCRPAAGRPSPRPRPGPLRRVRTAGRSPRATSHPWTISSSSTTKTSGRSGQVHAAGLGHPLPPRPSACQASPSSAPRCSATRCCHPGARSASAGSGHVEVIGPRSLRAEEGEHLSEADDVTDQLAEGQIRAGRGGVECVVGDQHEEASHLGGTSGTDVDVRHSGLRSVAS